MRNREVQSQVSEGKAGMNKQIPKEAALFVRGHYPTQSMTAVDQMQPLPAKSNPGKKDLGNKYPINSSPTGAFLWELLISQSSRELNRKRLIDETDTVHTTTFTLSRAEKHVEVWLRRCEHKSQLTHNNFYFWNTDLRSSYCASSGHPPLLGFPYFSSWSYQLRL